MIPTIWPRRRPAPIRLAENANDYPAPLSEGFTIFTGQPLTPAEDPSYCCERCEHLTELIREAGGVKGMADHLIAEFERQLEAIHR